MTAGHSPGFLRLFLAQVVVTLHRTQAKVDAVGDAGSTFPLTPDLVEMLDRALESGKIGRIPELMLDAAVGMVMGELGRRPGLDTQPRNEHLRNCDGNPCECGADPPPLKLTQKGPHAEVDGYRIVVGSAPDVPNALAHAYPFEGGSVGLASAGVYATPGRGVVLSLRNGQTVPASVVRALLTIAEPRP